MALVNGTGEVNGYKIEPGADLEGADLRGADLTGADLYCANLFKADLYGAKLERAYLGEANLSFTDLREADLTGAKLMHADLQCADLADAHLGLADFTGATLASANLSGTDLGSALLEGANFNKARVDPAHIPFIEKGHKSMLASLKMNPVTYTVIAEHVPERGPRRLTNPGQPHSWGPHHDSYYDHPSVKDHVAISITPAGRAHLKNSQGPSFHLIVLERLCQVPSLPQFVLEGELGVSGAMLHALSEEGLITAFIEDRPARPRDIERATEYSDDDHNLEYQHRKMLRLRHPNPGYGHHRGYGRRR